MSDPSTSEQPAADSPQPERAVTGTGRAGRPTIRTALRRRRPVRRALIVVHRWTSLVLGLVLVVLTTSGAVLLYEPDYFRATHDSFFRHTESAHPLTADQAIQVVQAAHPHFAAAWANADHGIWEVGDADYSTAWGVDAGSGAITGFTHLHGGTFGLLANLHECALGCEGYPGYVAVLAKPVPTLGMSWLDGLNWGGATLALLGLVLLLLAVSGLIVWWPGIRRLSHGFRIRMRRGRFARDYDLHRVIGAVAVPFLLMWGLTGAGFEIPAVQKAWLAVTGGSAPDASQYDFTAAPAKKGAALVTVAQASAAAVGKVPGSVVQVAMPTPDAGYYGITIARSYDPYAYEMFRGDGYVMVDAHNAAHLKVATGGPQPAANALYDRILEPAHFGWQVNGWWRIIWAVFGLAPLLLAFTGVSTWLVRRRTRKERAARSAGLTTASA
ncbi:PepSY-associated TM helix domain-containing protein [Streptomyces aureus]|uniref:PepSY-associated TM helix domain-containing protein n=1 Tax=Streptomyces aureus TaxID=193461 RepID=UPI0033D82D29